MSPFVCAFVCTEETRPFTVREYARIQTFPDDWIFQGSMTAQYAQIGNAVPVNFAEEIGRSLVRALNEYYATIQMLSKPSRRKFS